jgi:hypothetical protein
MSDPLFARCHDRTLAHATKKSGCPVESSQPPVSQNGIAIEQEILKDWTHNLQCQTPKYN